MLKERQKVIFEPFMIRLFKWTLSLNRLEMPAQSWTKILVDLENISNYISQRKDILLVVSFAYEAFFFEVFLQ